MRPQLPLLRRTPDHLRSHPCPKEIAAAAEGTLNAVGVGQLGALRLEDQAAVEAVGQHRIGQPTGRLCRCWRGMRREMPAVGAEAEVEVRAAALLGVLEVEQVLLPTLRALMHSLLALYFACALCCLTWTRKRTTSRIRHEEAPAGTHVIACREVRCERKLAG